MQGVALFFIPALAMLVIGLWRGKTFSRWGLASAVAIIALVAASLFALPNNFELTVRGSLVAIALMCGAGLVGPAISTSKTVATIGSVVAALFAAFPASYVAYYAIMSYACSRGPCY